MFLGSQGLGDASSESCANKTCKRANYRTVYNVGIKPQASLVRSASAHVPW